MPLTPIPGSIYPKSIKDDNGNDKVYNNWGEQLNDYLYNESILVVDNIEALKKLNPIDLSISNNTQFKNVFVKGYYTPNDGGGGLFQYNTNSTEREDKGLIFLPNSITNITTETETIDPNTNTVLTYNNSTTPGRYERIWDKSTINVRWFGAKGDGVWDDWEGVQRAAHKSVEFKNKTIKFPNSVYFFKNGVLLKEGICILGESRENTVLKTNLDISFFL